MEYKQQLLVFYIPLEHTGAPHTYMQSEDREKDEAGHCDDLCGDL